MNAEAVVVLFDNITKRKEYLSRRIKECDESINHLVGSERKEALIEVDLYYSERNWVSQHQLELMRALFTGGK